MKQLLKIRLTQQLSPSLQVVVKPLDDTAVEVETGVTAVDAVVAVGVNELHEGLVGLHQRFGKFRGITQMDVVVCRAVAEEQGAM